MNPRHEIIGDQRFWERLEFVASAWLEDSEIKTSRQFWIDGFLPETIRDTQLGADVEGVVWVGKLGTGKQWPYRFITSLPQKMLYRRGNTFTIRELVSDEAQQTLQLTLS